MSLSIRYPFSDLGPQVSLDATGATPRSVSYSVAGTVEFRMDGPSLVSPPS